MIRSVAFGRMFSGALLGAVFGPTLGAVIIQVRIIFAELHLSNRVR